MVKHTQAIRRNLPTNCFSVFGHFVILGLNRLKYCDLAKASIYIFTQDIGLEILIIVLLRRRSFVFRNDFSQLKSSMALLIA